ncbi:MAG: glycosyltransferase family 2 protein [Desulfovibrionaceae bacterium]|nr:glycosyltransferase family 2 protein [Desulfovibrionaceae bacterium]
MKLSIVTTLYGSSETLREFHTRASRAAAEFAGEDYEIIMVNDASPDDSLSQAKELFASDPHLIVVDLARNFGQHSAMMAGIGLAKGDFVFALDDDLEEEPEWLSLFAARMRETGADHVFGVQERRKGKFFERVSGSAFYSLFNALSDTKIPPNQIMAKLMTRRFVDALLTYQERTFFLAGILALTGFVQVPLTCHKKSKGSSTYNLSRKVEQAITSLTSFSTKPLLAIFFAGTGLSVLALVLLIYLVMRKLIFGAVLDGWTSIMALMTLGFGVVTAVLGIIGIYIARIFVEVKKRPLVTIRDLLSHASSDHTSDRTSDRTRK